jgi:hypothetical protein
LVGFFIRRHVTFDKAPPGKGFPLSQAMREQPIEMLQVVGICVANAVGFYLIFVYVTTWLKLYAQMKIGSALLVNSINMAIMLGVILGAAWLSDKIGRKPVMAAAAIGMALFAWPLMALMQTGDFMNVFLGQLGFVLLIGSYNAVNPIAICELFPARCAARPSRPPITSPSAWWAAQPPAPRPGSSTTQAILWRRACMWRWQASYPPSPRYRCGAARSSPSMSPSWTPRVSPWRCPVPDRPAGSAARLA